MEIYVRFEVSAAVTMNNATSQKTVLFNENLFWGKFEAAMATPA
jgi:hypothetical protein